VVVEVHTHKPILQEEMLEQILVVEEVVEVTIM